MFLNDLTNHFQVLLDISYIAYSNKLFFFLKLQRIFSHLKIINILENFPFISKQINLFQ